VKLVSFFLLTLSIAAAQSEPAAGQWKTWVLSSGSQAPLPAPPGAAETADELAWLRDFVASGNATTSAQVEYWDAGSPGYRWMQTALDQVNRRGIGGPASTRALSLVAVAIYDGIIAAWKYKYMYNRPRPGAMDAQLNLLVTTVGSPSYPSEHAVAAGAASTALAYLFPDSADQFRSMAEEAAHSRLYAGASFPSDTNQGLALGRAVGDLVVNWGKTDGSDAQWNGVVPPGPGKWTGVNPVAPLAGSWRPWALNSASDLRLATPPAYDSPEEATQLAAVKNLNRTPAIAHTAWFWQPSFTTPWMDLLSRKLFEYRLDTDAPRAARAYALLMTAQHDAILACWDTKYTYWAPRPVQVDPAIVTLFPTPNHPSFPSGHACAGGGMAAAMGYLFPDEQQSFVNMASDAGLSTFYAGVHFPLDVDAGLNLGQAAARKAIDRTAADGSSTH